MKKFSSLLLAGALCLGVGFYAGRAGSGETVIAPYVTDSQTLVSTLEKLEFPIAVQVGSGYKAGPLRLEYRCMSLDIRAGWYDKHVDSGNCVVIIVISDTSRAAE